MTFLSNPFLIFKKPFLKFAEKVWKKLTERPENERGPLNLIMFIESAKAVMNMKELCQKAEDLSTMAPIKPVALVLGADDLLASLRKDIHHCIHDS